MDTILFAYIELHLKLSLPGPVFACFSTHTQTEMLQVLLNIFLFPAIFSPICCIFDERLSLGDSVKANIVDTMDNSSFVDVASVNPNITTSLRYVSYENFIGRPLVGYHANRSLLTRQAAEALSRAEKRFESDGYRLMIYDAYRPQSTVDEFIEWVGDMSDQRQKVRDC